MVTINNHTETAVDLGIIREAVRLVCAEKNVKKKLSFNIVDNGTIRDLNNRYLHKDRPTNVISFPYPDDRTMLGEVFVSADFCAAERDETGLELHELIVFYFIHGLLHLLGYDHVHGGKEERRMRNEEERLFHIAFPGIELEHET